MLQSSHRDEIHECAADRVQTKKKEACCTVRLCFSLKKYMFLMVNNNELRQLEYFTAVSVLQLPSAQGVSFALSGQVRMFRAGNDLRSPPRLWSLMTVLQTFSSCSDANDERHAKPASGIDLQLRRLSLVSAISDLDSPARPSSSMPVQPTCSSCSDVNDERHAKPDPDIDLQ